jgi:hypothetical protein
MSEFEHATPRPWKVMKDDAPGLYRIIGRQGPVQVQPATAYGRDDTELIVTAVNAFEPMKIASATVCRRCRLWHGRRLTQHWPKHEASNERPENVQSPT